MNELQVKLNDSHIGTISIEGKDEVYKFEYIEEWEQSGYKISPHLAFGKTIASGVIKRFLENLLPEGKGLDDLTTFTHVSKNNIFGLIQAMGFETSGALSFGNINQNATPLFRPITKKNSRNVSMRLKVKVSSSGIKNRGLALPGFKKNCLFFFKTEN